MRSPLALLLLASLALGCRRETPKTPTDSVSAQLTPRSIPLRIVQMVGACKRCNPALACGPQDQCLDTECAPDLLRPESVEARIQEANQVYARAGISFYLGSLEKYAMPELVDLNQRTALPWWRVRFQIRQALPHVACDAFPPEMALTPREWVVRASTIFSPFEAIPFWVTSVGMGGYGIYPWRARAILIDANQINRHRDTNFSHEIGHFLGLSHSFGSPNLFHQGSYNLEPGTLLTPPSRKPVSFKEYWDLTFRPGPPSNLFFLRREDVRAEDEPLLQPIQMWDVSPTQPSNCVLDQRSCRYTCNVNGELMQTGDPRLRSLAFVQQSQGADGSLVEQLGINIMDYNQSPSCTANGLSESQVRQLRSVLASDIMLDDQRAYPGMNGARSRLGILQGPQPRARLDIDHDHPDTPPPPAQLGMHPAWAEELLGPGEPTHQPALASYE